MDIKKLRKEAEAEIAIEQGGKAKELVKTLLRRQAQAKQVLANIERELNDTYAELGRGTSPSELASKG